MDPTDRAIKGFYCSTIVLSIPWQSGSLAASLTHWGRDKMEAISQTSDDIFKCIFLNENVWIPIELSLKFVPKGPIDNIPALV